MRRCNLSILVAIVMLLVLALVIGGCAEKQAATYPVKPISIIIPAAVGGTTDIHSRLVAPYIEKALGQPVTIVNKPGAGGTIGHREVARAKPDGYTISCTNYPDSPINTASKGDQAGYKNDDLVMIAGFTRTPGALQVLKDGPFKDIKDFVAYAKTNPGKLTVGVSADGWMLQVLELEQAFGIKVNPIRVKSGGEGNNALLGKHIMAHMGGAPFAVTGADKGIVAILVTGGEKRWDKLPNAPTFKELGFDISYENVKAFAVPKGTPEPVIKALRTIMADLAKNPEFKNKVEGTGEAFGYMDTPEIQKYYKELCTRVASVVEKHKSVFSQE